MTPPISTRLSLEPSMLPCWLSWVGATTGCLQALGLPVDLADVGAQSTYAFRINIHKTTCVSAPTVCDWSTFRPGIHRLGRTTEVFWGQGCHVEGHKNETTFAHARKCFEFVRAHLAAGHPCVLWGTYVPEFGIAVGTTEKEEYLTAPSCMPNSGSPIKFDALAAPGGHYALAFPEACPAPADAARQALQQAVNILAQQQTAKPDDYATGIKAYDYWINALTTRTADAWGNSYSAQCWANARAMAHTFVARAAQRCEITAVKKHLEAAASAAGECKTALAKVAELFPFPGKAEHLSEPAVAAAVPALRAAQQADVSLLHTLASAMIAWPG